MEKFINMLKNITEVVKEAKQIAITKDYRYILLPNGNTDLQSAVYIEVDDKIIEKLDTSELNEEQDELLEQEIEEATNKLLDDVVVRAIDKFEETYDYEIENAELDSELENLYITAKDGKGNERNFEIRVAESFNCKFGGQGEEGIVVFLKFDKNDIKEF